MAALTVNPVVMLVGNKGQEVRVVEWKKASDFALSIGCDFLEISAKKTSDVDLAFQNIVWKLRKGTNRTRTGGWRWLHYISLTINKLFIILRDPCLD